MNSVTCAPFREYDVLERSAYVFLKTGKGRVG